MLTSGTLLFTAELNRLCRFIGNNRQITCSYPRNNKVEQVLQQIRIFNLLRKKERLTPSADDVIYWRFVDGSLAEGEKANAIIEKFTEKISLALAKVLYNGIVEAMTNCVHHAYVEARDDELSATEEAGWWMFAQEKSGRLSIVICDLGIGIPNSLPKTHEASLVRRTLEALSRAAKVKGYRDVDFIRAALEIGNSRTRQPGRGYGVAQLRAVVESIKEGSLRIYSNKGCYTYGKQHGNPSERHDEYGTSIHGTLIEWSVPLAKLT